MATRTHILPGFGVWVNVEDDKTIILPSFGVIADQATAAAVVSAAIGAGLTEGILINPFRRLAR